MASENRSQPESLRRQSRRSLQSRLSSLTQLAETLRAQAPQSTGPDDDCNLTGLEFVSLLRGLSFVLVAVITGTFGMTCDHVPFHWRNVIPTGQGVLHKCLGGAGDADERTSISESCSVWSKEGRRAQPREPGLLSWG